MGQKLAKDRKPSEGQVYNFKTSSDSLNRTNARPTNPDYDPDRVDTDLLRSEEKTFSKRQLGLFDKQIITNFIQKNYFKFRLNFKSRPR